MDLIENTLKQLFNLISNEGKLPLASDSTKENQVQVCDGIPGLIPLYIVASEVFPKLRSQITKLLKSASKLVWNEGLVRHSTSLYNGVAGNAVMMHSLHRNFEKLSQVAVEPK
jgi:hypothetical protein